MNWVILILLITIRSMETTNFGAAASLLFVAVPVIFLIGLYLSTADGEKSSFFSDTGKGRLSPKK